MITDQDVIDLYRNLLGRDPENAGTIAAFQSYYPSVERGRRAIFTSAEFTRFHAQVTGGAAGALAAEAMVATSLALALLEHAPPASHPANRADPVLAAGMRLFFPASAPARFAVAIGHPAGPRLDDLAPLGHAEAAVLHIAPGGSAATPRLSRLADGTAHYLAGGDAESVGALLDSYGHRIDALYLLDRPAGPHWVDRLRRHFADRALIVIGPAQAGFDPALLEAEIRRNHHCETPVQFAGLRIAQVGGWLLPVTYTPPAEIPPATDRTAFPPLALAAIVRNEAVCVENMLRSALPIASYAVLLDTGSDDETPAIARRVLSESGLPHQLAIRDRAEFHNDFAAMRNAALALVPDWVRWILMLDADEELAPEDLPALLALIEAAEDTDAQCFALPRYNYAGPDKSGQVTGYPDIQIRLLRHTPDRLVTYTGAVHETVRAAPHIKLPSDASALGGPRGGPHIHHLVRRFRTPEEEANKQDFYRRIATKEERK